MTPSTKGNPWIDSGVPDDKAVSTALPNLGKVFVKNESPSSSVRCSIKSVSAV